MAVTDGARRRVQVVREALRVRYLSTVVTVMSPEGGILTAPEAAKQYGELWVVTACNPYSEVLTPAENAARTEALRSKLDEDEIEYRDAVGRSPDGQWQEQSVALIGSGPRRARRLGRDLNQNAVFRITKRYLTVEGCQARWSRRRPHGEDWEPSRYSEATLPELVADTLGTVVDANFHRFHQPGWRLDGNTALRCENCSTDTWLASALLRSKAGEWYEAKALICPECASARLPSHLEAQVRAAMYAWSDWHLAATDAAAHPSTETWRCYVIGLDDPTGTRLARDREWVYVGQTSKTPEERYEEHLAGVRSSRHVRNHGIGLRSDLMVDLPTHHSQIEAEAYETYLAARLALEGYGVKGGH